MSDIASLVISITALIISSTTALAGLLIAWYNYRKTFDPKLIMKKELNSETDKKEVCLKNTGNGTAHSTEITIHYQEKDVLEEYHSPVFDNLEKGEREFIHDDIFLTPNDEQVDVINLIEKNLFPVQDPKAGVALDSKEVLIEIYYENEGRRILRTHLLTYQFDNFYYITKSRFIQIKKAIARIAK